MNRIHLTIVAGVIVAVVGVVVVVLLPSNPSSVERRPTSRRTLPQSSNQKGTDDHKAARSDVYVGSQACAACHQGEFDSYLRTAHSRSFSKVDPQVEPADVVFQHGASGRTYEVQRTGSEIVHRESLTADPSKPPSVVVEFPVKYLIGSGRHTRSYIVEDDGFLAESPITWYAAKQSWDMSPGYDRPRHRSFERATDLGCLICHVGRVERIPSAPNRPKIVEMAIGCERCHGPAGKHVAERTRVRENSTVPDSTIVHPARLSRELAESICAECHLRGDATVTRRGQDIDAFRPGTSLHDFRIDYHLRTENSTMKVVGHVDQMRLSKCYQSSTTLTCTTCHDPHGPLTESVKVEYFRERCLECHQDSCKLDESVRRRKSAEDNCVTCHMPQTETDIRHLAFTHHRIGLHAEQPKQATDPPSGQLVALDMPADLTESERDRCLGLAYLELSDRTAGDFKASYLRRALELMRKAYDGGENDGELLAGMSRILWQQGNSDAVGYASEALRDQRISERATANALVILAETTFRGGDLMAAREALVRLVEMRRQADDWLLLGKTQSGLGQSTEALKSLRRAAQISPFRDDIQRAITEGP